MMVPKKKLTSWTNNPVMSQDEKRELTLKKQSSATKEEDLLQQGQKITDKEQKLQQNWRIYVAD